MRNIFDTEGMENYGNNGGLIHTFEDAREENEWMLEALRK